MDAISFLTEDHRKVRKLLDDLGKTTNRAAKKRTDLLAKIAAELEAHTAIEEEIFYPAFKQAGQKGDDAKMFFEAMEEHRARHDPARAAGRPAPAPGRRRLTAARQPGA